MPTVEIICLANSLKHGGRCIAGFKTDGSGWLRPVSARADGTLHKEDYTLSHGREPQLFNILKIECDRPHPRIHQPENWLLSDRQWEYLGWPTIQQLNQLFKPEIQNTSGCFTLLGNQSDRVELETLQDNPASSSLCLIKPKKILWKIKTFAQKRKFRAIFNLNGTQYNLGITDPHWKSQLEQLEDGEHTCQQVITALHLENFDPEKFLLTISLSEPFQPTHDDPLYCFKLVAAVINTANVRSFLDREEKQADTQHNSLSFNRKLEVSSPPPSLLVDPFIYQAVYNCWHSCPENERSHHNLRQTLQDLLAQTLDEFVENLIESDVTQTEYHQRIEAIRKKYPQAYTKWTVVDDEELHSLFQDKMNIKDLAQHFQRQPSAIRSRLKKLNLII